MPNSPGEPPRIIVAPTRFVPLLQDCLLGAIREAAEDLALCEFDLDAYPPALARFDRIRALLDSTEWGEHGDIDLHEHSDALRDALTERLRTERAMQATAERDQGEQERRRASENARQIEAFMREAGLTIPAGGGDDA
jgi:hypothetical protein